MLEFGHEYAFDLSVSRSPLVSVIVSNFNYKSFLKEAVDSVLDQTYPNIEVIVVDDGSTDGSDKIMVGYGSRIVSVLKENGGQASACNAGFRVSKGEIVIFLDADDVLLPDTVERVVAVFRSKSRVAKVQYRQRIVDASLKPTGEVYPLPTTSMPSGDMRPRLMVYGSYPWPSTSGNAFAAAMLHRIMPIPENVYRGMPDIYLCSLSAVFGEVISLEEPGVLYRIHGGNNYSRPASSLDLEVLRMEILAHDDMLVREKHLFSALYSVNTRNMGTGGHQSTESLSKRMISLKLDRRNHPFKETLWTLSVRGCASCVTAPISGMPWISRLYYLLWFPAMLLAPRPLDQLLAQAGVGNKKRWLRNKLFLLLKGR